MSALLFAAEHAASWPDAVLMVCFFGFLGFVVWCVTR